MGKTNNKSSATWSITHILGLIILFMGGVGLVLALLTGGMFRNLTQDSQQAALHELVKLKTDNQLQQLKIDIQQLAGQLLSRDKFRSALLKRSDTALQKQLHREFKRLAEMQQPFRLMAITVYSQRFDPRSESRASEYAQLPYITCPGLLSRARQRRGLHSLRIIDELCLEQGQLFYAMLVPVGGYRLSGYVVIVAEPVYSLLPVGESMQLPLQLALGDSGQVLFQAKSWPRETLTGADKKIISHTIAIKPQQTRLDIRVYNEPKGLVKKLTETSWLIMLSAGLVTLASILLALWIVQRTTIRPLRRLTQQLHRIQQDRSEIGKHVVHSATREIEDLTLGFNSMTTDLNEMYAKLEDLAFTDALTQLPNRYQLHQCLEGFTEDRRQQNPQRQFSFFLMDLDRFKTVNDTLGHHIGDQLLQQVGMRLQLILRNTDTVTRLDLASRAAFENDMVARLGGDEFAAILPDAKSEENAITVAKKIIHAMEETFTVDTHLFSIGISIGIVLYPQHDTDKHMLMRKADVAMYYAKKNRLGYVVYDPQQETILEEKQSTA